MKFSTTTLALLFGLATSVTQAVPLDNVDRDICPLICKSDPTQAECARKISWPRIEMRYLITLQPASRSAATARKPVTFRMASNTAPPVLQSEIWQPPSSETESLKLSRSETSVLWRSETVSPTSTGQSTAAVSVELGMGVRDEQADPLRSLPIASLFRSPDFHCSLVGPISKKRGASLYLSAE
ncbi:hypothetical protein P7C73_g103, partial [Tremellales sp. Uapishka_1]